MDARAEAAHPPSLIDVVAGILSAIALSSPVIGFEGEIRCSERCASRIGGTSKKFMCNMKTGIAEYLLLEGAQQ